MPKIELSKNFYDVENEFESDHLNDALRYLIQARGGIVQLGGVGDDSDQDQLAEEYREEKTVRFVRKRRNRM